MLRQGSRGGGVAPQHGCQCTHAAGFCCPPPSPPPQAGGRVLLQPHGSALAHVLPAAEKIAEWGRGKKREVLYDGGKCMSLPVATVTEATEWNG